MFAAPPERADRALPPCAAVTVMADPVERAPGFPATGAEDAAGASGTWRGMWNCTAAAATADIRTLRRIGVESTRGRRPSTGIRECTTHPEDTLLLYSVINNVQCAALTLRVCSVARP